MLQDFATQELPLFYRFSSVLTAPQAFIVSCLSLQYTSNLKINSQSLIHVQIIADLRPFAHSKVNKMSEICWEHSWAGAGRNSALCDSGSEACGCWSSLSNKTFDTTYHQVNFNWHCLSLWQWQSVIICCSSSSDHHDDN
jgi:hypothetical protein